MDNNHSIKANQVFLSWCKKNPSRIKRAIEEHITKFFTEDRTIKCQEKFWKGAREHQQEFTKFTDQELDMFIEEEIIDLMFYIGLKVSRRKVHPSALR